MGFDGRPSVFADRYEPVSHLSRSIASTTPDVLSRTLGTLFQPIFPCDFVNIVVLDRSEGDVSWKSFGSEELARLDASPKDTTVWCVYEEEKPLWVSDWHTDHRLKVQKEAAAAGFVYRSLCRL